MAPLLDSERRLRQVLQSQPLAKIGAQIRLHRERSRMSVRELAAKAMVSKTSVVALEHGRSCSPATLAKICAALDLHHERLAASPPTTSDAPIVQRASEQRWYDVSDLGGGPLADKNLNADERAELRRSKPRTLMTMFHNVPSDSGALVGTMEVTDRIEERRHPGGEFVLVLRGAARIYVGTDAYELHEEDSIFIPAMAPHSYESASGTDEPVLLLALRLG